MGRVRHRGLVVYASLHRLARADSRWWRQNRSFWALGEVVYTLAVLVGLLGGARWRGFPPDCTVCGRSSQDGRGQPTLG
jgi:hypothetical protein